MFQQLYGLYPYEGAAPLVAAYEKTAFGFKAKELDIPVPKITQIVRIK
jgi:hypothetical protein